MSTTRFSAQQVTSCDTGSYGCGGGWTSVAFTYMMTAGLENESDYPYVSGTTTTTGTCTYSLAKAVVKPSAYYSVAPGGSTAAQIEQAMASHVLATGPLSICLDASLFNSYSGGIMASCGTSVNHCIQAVGINLSAATPYWIVSISI